VTVLCLLGLVGLASGRPWRAEDERWFHASALLAAILVAVVLFAGVT
jgi:hypothetical protein